VKSSEVSGIFTDVPKESWFAQVVETASSLGLVNGIGNGEFRPDTNITREQLAVIAMRLYSYNTGYADFDVTENTFTDSNDISDWAQEAVDYMQSTGIMEGSGGRFYPKRSTTRQEAAVVLYRLLEYMDEF